MNNYETLIQPVETGLTAGDHQAAMQAYEAFLELPYEIKAKLTYPGESDRARNTRAGYFDKNGKDVKQVFHYTLAADQYITALNPHLAAEAKTFMATAAELYAIAANGLGKILDSYNPLLRSIHFPTFPLHNNHLRFLRYEPSETGKTIAAGHYDQATVTVALCESAPGLRVGNNPTGIADYIRDPNLSVTFPGYGWLNLHRQLGIATEHLPAWHDVIQPDIPKELARMSIIMFANPAFMNTMPTPEQTTRPLSLADIAVLEVQGVLASLQKSPLMA